jgi:hypothetical protein
MAKILLSPNEITHVFSIKFPTDEGIIKNRDLPEEDQVVAVITVPTPKQKETLRTLVTDKKGNSKFIVDEERCARNHCVEIRGLKAYEITDGRTLANHPACVELNEIMQELSYVVLGIYKDPDSEDEDSEEEV